MSCISQDCNQKRGFFPILIPALLTLDSHTISYLQIISIQDFLYILDNTDLFSWIFVLIFLCLLCVFVRFCENCIENFLISCFTYFHLNHPSKILSLSKIFKSMGIMFFILDHHKRRVLWIEHCSFFCLSVF